VGCANGVRIPSGYRRLVGPGDIVKYFLGDLHCAPISRSNEQCGYYSQARREDAEGRIDGRFMREINKISLSRHCHRLPRARFITAIKGMRFRKHSRLSFRDVKHARASERERENKPAHRPMLTAALNSLQNLFMHFDS